MAPNSVLTMPAHAARVRPAAARTSPTPDVSVADLSRACFGCEGEDAQLTGMTRSPLRRTLALNLGGSLLHAARPQPVSPSLRSERIA